MDQNDPQSTSLTPEQKVGSTPPLTLKILPPVPGYQQEGNPSNFVFDQINELRHFTVNTAKSSLGIGEKCAYWFYLNVKKLSKKWFTHCFLTIVLIIYTILGAIIFKTVEGPHEGTVHGVDIQVVRYVLLNEVTNNLYFKMPVENQATEWRDLATERVNTFSGMGIQNHKIEDFIEANRGRKEVWNIWNSMVFCATLYTTIGYGHMYPKTTTGRALSIVYALIGIPLFIIALTDFGKLFTSCIKSVWSFVRRFHYYTGSCRRARKTAAAGDVMTGAQMFHDIPTFRRPSKFSNVQSSTDSEKQAPTTDMPTTPALSNFEIDDKFNLPISVALFILLSYILCGAVMYMMTETWDFFEAFYFVFISMSTIGFGDYVPRDPVFMIISIIYLLFGLALMSMCINVVQAKLRDTFKEASAKISATMGLDVDEDDSIIIASPKNMDNNMDPIFVSNASGSFSEKK